MATRLPLLKIGGEPIQFTGWQAEGQTRTGDRYRGCENSYTPHHRPGPGLGLVLAGPARARGRVREVNEYNGLSASVSFLAAKGEKMQPTAYALGERIPKRNQPRRTERKSALENARTFPGYYGVISNTRPHPSVWHPGLPP
jgi:hypothetical protein